MPFEANPQTEQKRVETTPQALDPNAVELGAAMDQMSSTLREIKALGNKPTFELLRKLHQESVVVQDLIGNTKDRPGPTETRH